MMQVHPHDDVPEALGQQDFENLAETYDVAVGPAYAPECERRLHGVNLSYLVISLKDGGPHVPIGNDPLRRNTLRAGRVVAGRGRDRARNKNAIKNTCKQLAFVVLLL